MARLQRISAFLFVVLTMTISANAMNYRVVILHPSGFNSSSANGISGGQQVGGGYCNSEWITHALLWSGTAVSVVDLHPSRFVYSTALSISGGQQVGYGGFDSGGWDGWTIHALLWTGTAGSVVDLNHIGFTGSCAYGISGGQQVGFGVIGGGSDHALLWSGTADSVVDLHPSGFNSSRARSISGGQQVGSGFKNAGSSTHALLWSGTADSVVDLHPSGFISSIAYDISGGQQVGIGLINASLSHALLWSGTADSVVDLHPSGFSSSLAYNISGGQQVGYGAISGGSTHALLWSGTAGSVVDLHSYLPTEYSDYPSVARAVDSSGAIVGSAYTTEGVHHAVMWIPEECPPLPPHEPWSFVQISDTHIASTESRKNLCLILNKVIKEENPAFIVNTGDIVDYGCGRALSGGEYCKFDFYESYSQAMKLATDAGIHVHNIPGNHDQKRAWPYKTVCDTFPSCFGDPLGNTDNEFHLGRSTFSYNDILFPVLDTGNHNCSGTLTDDDINFLKDLNPCIPKVILTHHPGIADPDDGGWLSDEACPLWGGVGILDGREDFIKYCENPANNVYVVLSGHTHNNQVYDKDIGSPTSNPWYIQTGSTLDGVARIISFASSGPPTIKCVQLTEEDYNYESCELHSPGNLHAYDSDGRHTGYDPGSGSEHGIPHSVYFSHYVYETEEGPIEAPEEVLILDPTDDYLWEVVGTEGGTYGLDITSKSTGQETAFKAIEIPTSPGARHIYAVDWQALSAGEEGVILEIDNNGDGVFEKTVIADKDLTSEEFALQTQTVIDFKPETLNLDSEGKFVTLYIELPQGCDVSKINVSSLKLNDTVAALSKPVAIGDYDSDGIADLMVKFDRQQVGETLEPGEQKVTLTGRLVDGTPIAGMDIIRVLTSKGGKNNKGDKDNKGGKDNKGSKMAAPGFDMTASEENLGPKDDDAADTGAHEAFNPEEAIVFMLFEAGGIINELGPKSFKNEGSATELTCAINDVFTMLDEGMYFEALDVLETDILQRTDGCANIGKPDKDDWITSFEGQALLYPLVTETIELLESFI